MVPDPLPPFKAIKPFLLIGLAAGAAAVALWARRKVANFPRNGQKLIRVEPIVQSLETVEVPWGTEVR